MALGHKQGQRYQRLHEDSVGIDISGNVPDDFDALLSLPGVGRKSANLVMGDVFGKPAIVTDTHCIRLVNRMGLVDGIKEPEQGGNGALEDHSAGGRQRFLPQTGISRKRGMYCQNPSLLRKMLYQ